LFERLRTWRAQTASELRQPAFCVFTDATLTTIAARRPRTRAELAGVPGVGAVKLDKYFEAITDIVDATSD
jgi:superfamily II DNA helicase RecQ